MVRPGSPEYRMQQSTSAPAYHSAGTGTFRTRQGCVAYPASALAFMWPSQATSDESRIFYIASGSALTGSPAKDSVVETRTPSGVSAKTHSWIPVIPPAVPPHRTRSRSAIS